MNGCLHRWAVDIKEALDRDDLLTWLGLWRGMGDSLVRAERKDGYVWSRTSDRNLRLDVVTFLDHQQRRRGEKLPSVNEQVRRADARIAAELSLHGTIGGTR